MYDVLLRQIPRLRRVSVTSPYADKETAAAKLTDRAIFAWKPNPAALAMPEVDWEWVERDIKETLEIAGGCCLEIVMKSTETFALDASRLSTEDTNRRRSNKRRRYMPEFIYRESKTKEISFPLGGIGTGCIGLAGNGRLIDWEIANRPNKGSLNGFSHFAVKAERNGEVLDAKVLNSDLPAPYTGDLNRPQFMSFGFGPPRGTMAGIPHFRGGEFQGEFPHIR